MSYPVSGLSEYQIKELLSKISNGYGLLISNGLYVLESLKGKIVTDPCECRYVLYDLLQGCGSNYFSGVSIREYSNSKIIQSAIDAVLIYFSDKDNWNKSCSGHHLVLIYENEEIKFKEVL